MIPSNFARAKSAEDDIIREAETVGYDEEAIFALRLSLEEALANAIRHGNGGENDKSVQIEYQVSSQSVEINISDEGVGFTPDDVPDPTTEDKLEIPSGRGILLMRAYMDVVEYNERGNAIHLVKYNTQPPQDRCSAETAGQLDMKVENFEQYSIITLNGSADMAETQALDHLLDTVMANGSVNLLLNLSELNFICSLGLGVLIKTQNHCRKQNGKLVLIKPQPPVMRVLKTTRLTELFKIVDSLQAALDTQQP